MLQYLLNYGLQQVWQQTLRYFSCWRDHQLSTSIRRKKSKNRPIETGIETKKLLTR